MFPSGASVNVWTLFNSCVWVPLLSSVSLLEMVQICQICWKTEESAFFIWFSWRTVLSLTVQNKQGTHEQTVIEHPVTTHSIKNQGFPNFEGGYFNNFSNFFYVNIFYVKCLTVLNKKYNTFCMISFILFKLLTFSQFSKGCPNHSKPLYAWTLKYSTNTVRYVYFERFAHSIVCKIGRNKK